MICGTLGIFALLALVASHLALTDISRGEEDLTNEWAIVQVSFVLIAAFAGATCSLLLRVCRFARGASGAE